MLNTNWIPFIGRTALAAIFIKSGLDKVLGFAATLDLMTNKGIPIAFAVLIAAILVELLGALSVIVGYKARWGAGALIVFLIPTTLIFHLNFADRMETIQFLKNLSILGGLLLIVTYGAGPWSMDGRPRLFS
jgi:uncharacterized membrane protein YphA (DoxX/SURF4 family)